MVNKIMCERERERKEGGELRVHFLAKVRLHLLEIKSNLTSFYYLKKKSHVV